MATITGSKLSKTLTLDTVITSGLTVNGIATITGNATIGGTLTVNGSTTTVNTATLSVEDPLIQLANNNLTTDVVDIGMVGLYDTSGSLNLYAGLFRDATDNKWKLFVDSQEDLSTVTTINTAATGYTAGTLVATFEGNGSAITALNAGNISTGTLAVARGGTGQITVTAFKDVLDDETWTFANDVTFNSNSTIMNIASARVKYGVYGTAGNYGFGMESGMNYGGIANDWAVTSCTSTNAGRGFWWGDVGHTTSQGAMSLTNDGKLTVAHSQRLGYGESDTTTPGATYVLDVSGNSSITGTLNVSGAVTLTTDLTVANGGTGLSTVATDNILTGNGTGALTSEANLTFDGSTLDVVGDVDLTGVLRINGTFQEGFLYPYYQTLTLTAPTVEGWYLIAVPGPSVRNIKVQINTTGDNSFSQDEFLISTSGYGFNHNIVHLPSTKYNGSKLVEIKTNNFTAAVTEIWIRVAANTLVGSLTVRSTFTIPTLVAATPTFGGTPITSIITSTVDRDTYSTSMSRGIKLGGAVATDTITETTAAAGVTIDGVLFKDGQLIGPGNDTPAVVLTSAAYATDTLEIGGWSTSNTATVHRIRASLNLHMDSSSDGDLYINWYSGRPTYFGNTGNRVFITGSTAEVHPETNNDGSLGLTGQRWGNLFVAAATVTGNITADSIATTHASTTSDTVTTSATTETTLSTFVHATYSTGEFLIQATSAGEIHSTKVLVIHDGVTAYATQYGKITTLGDLFTVQVDILSADCRVRITSASATSTVYKTSYTLVEA